MNSRAIFFIAGQARIDGQSRASVRADSRRSRRPRPDFSGRRGAPSNRCHHFDFWSRIRPGVGQPNRSTHSGPDSPCPGPRRFHPEQESIRQTEGRGRRRLARRDRGQWPKPGRMTPLPSIPTSRTIKQRILQRVYGSPSTPHACPDQPALDIPLSDLYYSHRTIGHPDRVDDRPIGPDAAVCPA
jgi:hypothetical protein